MPATIYHPKGSMCAVCIFNKEDCSSLPFKQMRVMKQYSPENDLTIFKVVKCDVFDKFAQK